MSKPHQQVDLLCAQSLFSSALSANLSIFAGTALISAYYYQYTGPALISWIVTMCLIAGARILLSRQYYRDQKNGFSNYSPAKWINFYTVSSFISGAGWASLVFYLPQNLETIHTSILYIIFFSIMAATVVALPVVLPAYFAYTTPIFIAALSLPFFINSWQTIYISIASVFYFLFLLVAGRILNRRYMQSFALHLENEALISKLHDEIIQKELAQKELLDNQLVLEETVEQRTKELTEMNEILVNEINERRRIESNLKHIAHHDNLTNLPNRLLLNARLDHAIERAKRDKLQVAIMFIDLDRFKTINDTLGHDVGDKLLIEISKRLEHCIREDDTVARLGGDEFIMIIEQVHDIGDLDALLKKIMKATSEPVPINEHRLTISASIGVSIYPDDGTTAEHLMRNADAAMYYVKENGRHKYHFYTRELTSPAYDRILLEADLKNSVSNNEIRVYYQPQLDLQSKKIVGVEALARWQHPQLGILRSKQFLHIAELSELIHQIGETVLTLACQQIAKWKQAGLAIETVAVNISSKQVHRGDLVELVKNTLQQTGCEPHWLELEIEQSLITEGSQQTITTLQQLRALGVSLVIDKADADLPPAKQLKKFPVNKLKIKRSIVRDIDDDMKDAAQVNKIISTGKKLQIKLVAEGVENSSHEIFLSAHGCDYVQGYYYFREVPGEQIEKEFSEKTSEKDGAAQPKIKLIKFNTD